MNKRATLEEVQAQIASVTAEIETLKAKKDSPDGLTPDEVNQFEQLVSQLESLKQEEQQLQSEQRYAEIKVKSEQPRNPAPKVAARAKSDERLMTRAEAIITWLKYRLRPEAITQEDIYRAKRSGFDILGSGLKFAANFNGLNYKHRQFMKRTKLATINTGAGAELVYTSYDPNPVEYLTYESSFIETLSTTTVSGNEHVVFRIDNTAMKSVETSKSPNSEINPNIPETNVVTSKVAMKLKTITSGYQKVTWEELQESYIDLAAEISKANALSHKRKIEDDVLNGTGDGSSDVQGLLDVATSAGSASAFNEAAIRGLIRAIPQPYRKPVILIASDTTAGEIYDTAVDDFGRSLFDRNIEADSEFDTLAGKKFYTSSYMPDDMLLAVNPEYYKLAMGNVEEFKFFEEKFFPDSAWAGLVRFGGCWVGPSDAIQVLSKSS
jgi:HK97 family phage major capsid protein